MARALIAAAILVAPVTLHAEDGASTVPFVTSRNISDGEGPSAFFGDERSGLSAGWCVVDRLDAAALDPVLDTAPAFLREHLLGVDRVEVLDQTLARDALLDAVRPASPALFVHGYFIDFDKGCRRASMLQTNAGLEGRLLWFSWPSDGDIASYARDEADLYWSVLDLADVIIELNAATATGERVDVLGHSLGARGVTLALYEIAFREPTIRLGHIVLLAPDVDFEIFARLLPRITPIVESITVYVTDEDRPLALSKQLHGYSRLGQAGNEVTALSGVEVIDVSAIPNESASGHLYHIHNSRVGDDLRILLDEGLLASERPNLEQTGANTWSLQN
ncbi:MAG: alpha/beta hydrolase [Pseudomonadota bacterium]